MIGALVALACPSEAWRDACGYRLRDRGIAAFPGRRAEGKRNVLWVLASRADALAALGAYRTGILVLWQSDWGSS